MSVYFQNSDAPSRTNSFNDEKDNEQIMATACNGLGINKNSYASPTLSLPSSVIVVCARASWIQEMADEIVQRNAGMAGTKFN